MILGGKDKHLSKYGVYNETTKGWCFLETAFRGSLATCEKVMVEFQRSYPGFKYRIATHSADCDRLTEMHDCCVPKKGRSK